MTSIESVMTQDPVTVHPDAPIRILMRLMIEFRVSGVPVVDDDGQLLGIVSEYDVLNAIRNSENIRACVRDHMTFDVKSVSTTDSLDDVCDLFLAQNLKRAPVMREGQLVGIVSRRDVVCHSMHEGVSSVPEPKVRAVAGVGTTLG